MARSSFGVAHVLSIPTFGPKRRTILATHGDGAVSLGTPLPDDGGWAFAMVLADGRTAVAEARLRGVAALEVCEDLGLDPVRILGRDDTERARKRREEGA